MVKNKIASRSRDKVSSRSKHQARNSVVALSPAALRNAVAGTIVLGEPPPKQEPADAMVVMLSVGSTGK